MKSIIDYTNKLKDFFAQKQALSDEVTTRATLGAHNLAEVNIATPSSFGVDFTNIGGRVKLNGTCTSSTANRAFNVHLKAGTYIASVEVLSGSHDTSKTIWIEKLTGTSGINPDITITTENYKEKQFDVATEGDYQIQIGISNGDSFNNLILGYTIRPVTDTYTGFLPYVPTNAQLLSYKDNGILGAKNLLNATILTWTSTAGENKSQTIGEIYLKAGTSIVFTVKQETIMTSNTRNTIIVTPKGQSANAVVEDNTANYMLSAGTHKMTYTAPADHTYVFSIWCHTPNVAITYSDFMVRLATDSDPTYQPYAMTNKELTDRIQVGVVTISDGNERVDFPKAFTSTPKIFIQPLVTSASATNDHPKFFAQIYELNETRFRVICEDESGTRYTSASTLINQFMWMAVV